MAEDFERQLISAARLAATGAYAPYSRIQFGCAVLFEDEHKDIYSGANIENAAYGSTICAERAAICAAVAKRKAEGKTFKLTHVAIARVDEHGDPIQAAQPCGACLQVIAEFGDDNTAIWIDGFYQSGQVERFKLPDFLPQPFYYPEAPL